MKTKQILILCFLGDPTCPSGSLSGTGGFNASVKDILDFVRKEKKIECIVITNTTGNYTKPLIEQFDSNIRLCRIFSSVDNILHKNTFSKEIDKYLEETERIVGDFAGISFIHSFYWLSGMIAAKLSIKYNMPFIHTTVSLAKQKLLAGRKIDIERQLDYENYFLNEAKYILTITEEEKRLLLQEYNIPEEKIIIEGQTVGKEFHFPIYDNYGIPNELSHDNEPLKPIGFKDLGISNGLWWNSGAFTYVGRITEVKGVDIIIKAWIELDKRFDKQIPPLWIIGNTPFEIEKFRKKLNIPINLLEQYEITKRIVWWGYLTPAAISTIFLKTAVLVTHSAFEAGGRVLLEAFCQGIPVISTNTGFGKDYISDWVNGFIVEYGDIEMLAFRMSHFIMNPFISSILGKNARTTFIEVEKNWNHKIRIIKLYESLLTQSDYKNSYNLNTKIKNEILVKDIVESYPYYYKEPTLNEIMAFLDSYSRDTVIMIEECRKLDLHDIWIVQQKYVIKYIYPKLNKYKIWHINETTNVWSASEILNGILQSTKSHVTLAPLKVLKDSYLILFPYMQIFTIDEIIENLKGISHCLKKFSETPSDSSHKELLLSSYWTSLVQDMHRLGNKEVLYLYEILPSNINDYLSNPIHFSGEIRIQYAQPLLGHVGILKNNIFLLPTYHWIYAQPGLDAGILFEELLRSSLVSTEMGTLQNLSQYFEVTQIQIIAWSICICLKNIIHDIVFQSDKITVDLSIYHRMIEVFQKLI